MLKKYAFYLPQFHPIAENDEWWGKGFTEWRNVVRSVPRFKGHYQPHLPSDLGFYDLRVIDTLSLQADTAKQNGIDAFCVYHYWFMGKELLDSPIKSILKSEINFPFFVCWANETWSRTWDGQDSKILIKQNYSESDDDSHAAMLVQLFADHRYEKINGRPIILIYRPSAHRDLKYFIAKLRNCARISNQSDPIVLGCVTGFDSNFIPNASDLGVDGFVMFQPNRNQFPNASGLIQRFINVSRRVLPESIYQMGKNNTKFVKLVNYSKLVDVMLDSYFSYDATMYPVVFPSWDNSARRSTPTVIQNLDPREFRRWLVGARDVALKSEFKFLFINAWNEWAEGCHLEPDLRFGSSFLNELKDL